ncbi:MAG: hypothetical protein KJO05_09575 [Bacteroidia bacterium]|nr:hypothetical protein [Bacteroidia bacterium]NNF30142.1 hypothetical protein [Flavobacteriaceae bacterium]MBT8275020.1 hypothetical protein [Bacteroidia bacterium]NNJ81798.1 hypothetical protein [Flavobacteriaceae bacterium]NNK55494.1 hypothetical protein [Flavobacteriaceae bacterium]
MKQLLHVLTICLIVSCSNQDPNDQKTRLGGYWVIEKVEMPGGSEKLFQLSTTIDFIEVTGDSGVRKKVQPKVDGSFLANDSAEKFDLMIENDSLHMYYKTPYDSWKETVLRARDSVLVVLNQDGKIYTYTKFGGLSVPEE